MGRKREGGGGGSHFVFFIGDFRLGTGGARRMGRSRSKTLVGAPGAPKKNASLRATTLVGASVAPKQRVARDRRHWWGHQWHPKRMSPCGRRRWSGVRPVASGDADPFVGVAGGDGGFGAVLAEGADGVSYFGLSILDFGLESGAPRWLVDLLPGSFLACSRLARYDQASVSHMSPCRDRHFKWRAETRLSRCRAPLPSEARDGSFGIDGMNREERVRCVDSD